MIFNRDIQCNQLKMCLLINCSNENNPLKDQEYQVKEHSLTEDVIETSLVNRAESVRHCCKTANSNVLKPE